MDQLEGKLSERDWKILGEVNRLHLATGSQLDRLFFSHLSGRSRISSRSRALSRLVSWRVLEQLPRRIGGDKRGSSVAVYAVGIAGKRLLQGRLSDDSSTKKQRRVAVPGERFMAHVLGISELYVQLTEADRDKRLRLAQFVTEPAAWWPDGRGGLLKPDAFIALEGSAGKRVFWLELDRATESVPTLGRKLRAYLDFVRRGTAGPYGAIPRVLITVPHQRRYESTLRLLDSLPGPAIELFAVVLYGDALEWLAKEVE
ncbi:replication-relaxation family protein [Amycolatopsis sp. NPDC101161]|uniref:replication-relaxation family protein n=1 Tax=Amycolatopsis sp. NPDC101161 TaxID=3363940 RepID=UPI00380AEBB7